MKKFITAALMFLMALQLGAQSKEVQALLKAYDKAKQEISDAKRATKPVGWIRYAMTSKNRNL